MNIVYIILTILLIVLAAASKAVADTLADHFGSSVFKNKNPKFWDKNVSWQTAKFFPLTRFRVDAWHIANSMMIIAGCTGWAIHAHIIAWYFELIIAGTVFNLSFDLFYDHILKSK